MTGASEPGDPGTRVVVGTEAVLHRVSSADAVAFLDFDQELTAPRYRAPEQALALLALAGRVVRGRRDHGRLLVQTRQPDHPVIEAALARRSRAGQPRSRRCSAMPSSCPRSAALALVSGPSAAGFHGAARRPARAADRRSRPTAPGGWSPPLTRPFATRWPRSSARRGACASRSTRSGCDRLGHAEGLKTVSGLV